ncbi:undecaprenyl-diphosphate phosphatase [Coraliomargarita parva]|uniref:undecaprenyl-diphosphate phosphatase n=1 Tax=Coraliomargarita parva TaxID=3014050 RepID=UPI0022B36FAE|nr:undecaprenyl-diphosphate phosphatase [Coraliomargarita parva]
MANVLFSQVDLKGEPLDPRHEAKSSLSYTDAVILGLVEGITEYLPVSSTGHLILTNAWLGLDSDTPLPDRNGAPVMVEGDDDGTTAPFTMGNAADAYAIIIQFGAILAVVLIYWKRILSIVLGVLGKDPNGLKLLLNLIVAFLPAAVLGLLLDEFIESVLFGIIPVVIALIAGGILMLIVTRWHTLKHRGESVVHETAQTPDLHELSLKKCLLVGFLQCVAMWPGTSRSMMTIVGGYLVGLSPTRAAEFSFLLGLVTLSAASAYKTLSVGPLILQTIPLGPILIGILVAAIAAALAVKWLVGFLNKHGLSLFAWYRIALGITVFFVLG